MNRGELFYKIYLISEGRVIIRDHEDDLGVIALPQFSFFGDYQLLMGVRSNVGYFSDYDGDTVCLTIDGTIFLNNCREFNGHFDFFHERASARRKYFRRILIEYRETKLQVERGMTPELSSYNSRRSTRRNS